MEQSRMAVPTRLASRHDLGYGCVTRPRSAGGRYRPMCVNQDSPSRGESRSLPLSSRPKGEVSPRFLTSVRNDKVSARNDKVFVRNDKVSVRNDKVSVRNPVMEVTIPFLAVPGLMRRAAGCILKQRIRGNGGRRAGRGVHFAFAIRAPVVHRDPPTISTASSTNAEKADRRSQSRWWTSSATAR